jgi:hypothetical protein
MCGTIMAHVAPGARLAIAVVTFTVTFLHACIAGGILSVLHKKWGEKISDSIPSFIKYDSQERTLLRFSPCMTGDST